MEIVSTRFSPPRLQQDVFHEAEDHIDEDELEKQQDEAMAVAHDFEKNSRAANVLRRLRRRRRRQKSNAPRRKKTERYFHGWQPPVHLNEDLRDVQLLALERRMRASKCLVLFPVRKQDADVMEHYFRKGYKKNQYDYDYDPELNQMGDAQDLSFDLQLVEDENDGSDSHHSEEFTLATVGPSTPDTSEKTMPILQSTPHPRVTETKTSPKGDTINTSRARPESASPTTSPDTTHNESVSPARDENESVDEPVSVELQHDLDQMIQDVHANITENVNRLSRVNLADGWDKGTTPDDMCDDLMLGLRDGFCGALSSFSSWESSMVGLMRDGQFGDAIVGYILGMQLPIIAYRFGQTVAVYIFIWRCRWETRRDARRGYGIRIRQEASDSDASDQEDDVEEEEEPEHSLPSVRAVATAIFVMALAAQVTSLKFYSSPEKQLVALSLLFSPLGVLSRWRLSKLNRWRPTFPLGTFCCNILACMLSGSLGSLLAGNPSPRQRIVLQSLVAGFGATLSSVAAFIVEVLSGVDPILFRFDGFFYAAMSVLCGMLASFLFDSTGEWVDQTESKGDVGNTTDTGLNDTQRLFFL
jgi:fluoride ion exporter CrcB/FEX